MFIEHKSLQHLLNTTNQTAEFKIEEHLNKWQLDVCVLGY